MAIGTHSISQHKPAPRGDYRTVWVLLALIALGVVAYAIYHGYASDQDTREYQNTTVMGHVLYEDALRA